MITEGAIGDAYGAGFEFADREKIDTKNTVSSYETHPLFEEIQGKYTDDTQMSIAIAELLIEEKEWTSLKIANKFVEVFKRDPRRGYAKRFYQFLQDVNSGEEFLEKIIPTSIRNGSAMRAYPIGILKSEQEIIEKCNLQSNVTHQSEEARTAAQAIALSSHFFMCKKGRTSDLLDYLKAVQNYTWQANWTGEVKVNAIETVEAVLTILLNENSLKNMLKKSIDFGGDVDTVASLTLAIGKMNQEIEHNLPQWLYDDIEQGEYGIDYIRKLDEQLLTLPYRRL